MTTCPICKNIINKESLKRLEADCLFAPIEEVNQHLIRYQCNICDVIFGSEEMLNLAPTKLTRAYQNVYASGYRENDASDFEFSLFQMLGPSKSGLYINWGSGTSSTSDKGNKEGYTLLNYDPGLPSMPNYSTREELQQLIGKIDGIISNNVLDHLQDPIKDLLFMKSLLKPNGSMIHASDGFRYGIDYTKFHLFFFVGKSVSFISDTIDMPHTFTASAVEGVDIVKWSKNDTNLQTISA